MRISLPSQQALDLTESDIATLGRNSFLASFMTDQEKTAAVEKFDTFRAKW